jgi:hypothetical protein
MRFPTAWLTMRALGMLPQLVQHPAGHRLTAPGPHCVKIAGQPTITHERDYEPGDVAYPLIPVAVGQLRYLSVSSVRAAPANDRRRIIGGR